MKKEIIIERTISWNDNSFSKSKQKLISKKGNINSDDLDMLWEDYDIELEKLVKEKEGEKQNE